MLLEYVSGVANIGLNLRQWIMKGRLDAATALEFAIQFCAAMRYAQETLPGFVHRDIKPENILINSARMVKVTDFGLALSIESPVAGGLRIGGTLLYMPPEQFTHERLDVRSDIYAFGCVLYEMFTGRPVFTSTSAEGYYKCHLEAEPVPPQTLIPSIPNELNDLILSCLQKPLARRPTNFEEVANVLTRAYERLTGQQPAQTIVSDDSEDEITSRALSLHNLKRTEEALELLDKVMGMVSPSDILWFIRGNMLLAISRFEEALDAYDRFLSVDSDEAIAGWINRGVCLYHLGRPEEALESFDRALALNPKSYEAWLSKAVTLGNLEHFAEAEQYLDGYLKIDPRDRDFLYAKGDLLSRQGLYAEAIAYFDRALSVDPVYRDAWSGKGMASFALEKWGMAQLCFERLTQIDEGNAGAWYKNGLALFNLRKFKEAVYCFDKVLTLSPCHQSASEHKALALQQLNASSEENTDM